MPDLGPPLQKYMQICLVSLALYRGLSVSVPPGAMAVHTAGAVGSVSPRFTVLWWFVTHPDTQNLRESHHFWMEKAAMSGKAGCMVLLSRLGCTESCVG